MTSRTFDRSIWPTRPASPVHRRASAISVRRNWSNAAKIFVSDAFPPRHPMSVRRFYLPHPFRTSSRRFGPTTPRPFFHHPPTDHPSVMFLTFTRVPIAHTRPLVRRCAISRTRSCTPSHEIDPSVKRNPTCPKPILAPHPRVNRR